MQAGTCIHGTGLATVIASDRLQLAYLRTGPMADTSLPARSSVLAPSAGEVVVGLLGAAVVSIAVNALIALVAGKITPADAERKGLALVEYAPATVIGILLGTLGWYLVRRLAADPRRVQRILRSEEHTPELRSLAYLI